MKLREKLAKRKLNETFSHLNTVIATINAQYANVDAQGEMACPQCGEGIVTWRKVAYNNGARTDGKCSTSGCIEWLQ